MVATDIPGLEAHVRCMFTLEELNDWLIIAPEHLLVRNTDRVHYLVETYQEMAPEMCQSTERPKLHYLVHIPQYIEMHKCMFTAFAPERRHKLAKSISNNCFGQALNMHPLKKLTAMHLEALQNEETYKADFLHNPKPAPDLQQWFHGHCKM